MILIIVIKQDEDRLQSYGFEYIGQFEDGQRIWVRESQGESRLVILDKDSSCCSYIRFTNKQ